MNTIEKIWEIIWYVPSLVQRTYDEDWNEVAEDLSDTEIIFSDPFMDFLLKYLYKFPEKYKYFHEDIFKNLHCTDEFIYDLIKK